MVQVNLKVAQLLVSRLCHDLIGPVGAINAGLELMEEGMEDNAPALELVAKSAGEATRRLTFFRVAFGFGSGEGGEATLAQARELALGFLTDGKVDLDWPQGAPAQPPGPVRPPVVKVVLNMVLIASECLPKGGVVGVNFADQDDGLGVTVTAAGEGARLGDNMIPALSEGAGPEDLSARNVHAHYAQSMARDIGATVAHAKNSSGEIQLAVLFPDPTGG